MRVTYVPAETNDCNSVMIPWFLCPSVPLIFPWAPWPLLISVTRPLWHLLRLKIHSVLLIQYLVQFLALFLNTSKTGLCNFSWPTWGLGFYPWFLVSMSLVALWVALELCTCCPRILPSAGCWGQPELLFRWIDWSLCPSEEAPFEPWL